MKKFLLFATLVTLVMVYACQKDQALTAGLSQAGVSVSDRGDTLNGHHHHGPCVDSLGHHHHELDSIWHNHLDSLWHSHLDSLDHNPLDSLHHIHHDSFPPPPQDTTHDGQHGHGGPHGPHDPHGPGGPHHG